MAIDPKKFKSKKIAREISQKQQDALDALSRVVKTKGDKQSVESLAFDIARSYNVGWSARELANVYREKIAKAVPRMHNLRRFREHIEPEDISEEIRKNPNYDHFDKKSDKELQDFAKYGVGRGKDHAKAELERRKRENKMKKEEFVQESSDVKPAFAVISSRISRALRKSGIGHKMKSGVGHRTHHLDNGVKIHYDGVGLSVKHNDKEIAYYSKPKLDYHKAIEKAQSVNEANLDELSKKTLGSYVKKASRDISMRSARDARNKAIQGHKPGINKRTMKNWRREIGIDKAIDKITKEETENIDEISKKTLGSYINKSSDDMAYLRGTKRDSFIKGKDGDKAYDKSRKREYNRKIGISRAVGRLTKEETENLDELSGSKLGAYIVKSKKDEKERRDRGIAVKDALNKATGKNFMTPYDRKLYNTKHSRGANQNLAMKKLTGKARVNAKEEVEHIDEISKKLAGRYINKATQSGANAGYKLGQQDSMDKEVDRFTNRNGMDDKYNARDKIKKSLGADQDSKNKTNRVIGKRLKGVKRATDKLTGQAKVNAREEVENIDEISLAKVDKYSNANEKDRERLSNKIGWIKDKKPTDQQKKDIAKLDSRVKMSHLANKKAHPYLDRSMGRVGVKVGAKGAFDKKNLHPSYQKYRKANEEAGLRGFHSWTKDN